MKIVEGDLEISDLADEDTFGLGHQLKSTQLTKTYPSRPLTVQELNDLKQLLFSPENRGSFSDEWKNKGNAQLVD